ncbi:CCN family member 3 [Parasteatoda tepidariorum]|uniref:CCN family member 3 n=1 Tax=Parasteatoda tepidariorum TaxID=114398 RepID=UPI00077F9C2C|nr:CCN family member 3 [Parasteatoda tepidariorum]XP_042910153.1 CCN family member 3 [Parasteatoda tepidariorum]
MYKELFLVLLIAYVGHAALCKPKCKVVKECPPAVCPVGTRRVLEGCACCGSCEEVLDEGDDCDPRPKPEEEISAEADNRLTPRVSESFPQCGKGLTCDPCVKKCQKND